MNTKMLFLAVSLIVGCSSAFAQILKETREVKDFDKISVSGGIDVEFIQSNTFSVAVETEQVQLEKIITRLSGSTLVIEKARERVSIGTKHIKTTVYVSAPELLQLNSSGGSDFSCKELTCKAVFEINSSGGSDVELGQFTGSSEIKMNTSGGADVDIHRLNASACSINASGGSDTEIDEAYVDAMRINSSGGSDVQIGGGQIKQLTINSSGGADVSVRGTIDRQTINTSGGADVYINGAKFKKQINGELFDY